MQGPGGGDPARADGDERGDDAEGRGPDRLWDAVGDVQSAERQAADDCGGQGSADQAQQALGEIAPEDEFLGEGLDDERAGRRRGQRAGVTVASVIEKPFGARP